jgi:hypothetical protein
VLRVKGRDCFDLFGEDRIWIPKPAWRDEELAIMKESDIFGIMK